MSGPAAVSAAAAAPCGAPSAGGCGDGFSRWAREHTRQLTWTTFRLTCDWHEAEDLTQDALIRLAAAWASIRHPDATHAFARRVIINRFIDTRRRPRPPLTWTEPDRTGTGSGEAAILGHGRCTSPDHAARVCNDTVLRQALAQLPPRARTIVVLRYFYALPATQVAAMLGCSVGNVKSQSSRALSTLRQLLPQD
jgi:RNA polymerase sigma factor (sigma-70 family)